MIAHIISGTTITAIVDFQPRVVADTHPNYQQIRALVADPAATEEQVRPLLDIPEAIRSFTNGAVYVKDGRLFHDGCEVRTSLGAKILQFIRQGDDALAEPLKLFLQNVSQNPDPRAQQDLYDWLQAAGLPITGDGMVLAWKAVRDDYRSIHSPNDTRFDHSVGNRVEQPRDECDANPDRTCSRGLHFCAANYLSNYASGGHRIVVVRIHPRDVVSFPSDYELRKGRACGYDVVGEVPLDKVPTYYPQGAPVYTGFDAPVQLEVGGVYRLRDDRNAVVIGERPLIGDFYLVTADGSRYAAKADGTQGVDEPYPIDAVARVRGAVGSVEPGQYFVNRAGQFVVVTSLNGDVANLSDTNAVFTRNGRQYADGTTEDPSDLVFRLN